MEPKFIIDRPKISDEEINKNKDFKRLLEQFKQQSLQKARQDKSWWRKRRVRYSTVIAGCLVVCTVTWLALQKSQTHKTQLNETLTTQNNSIKNKIKAESKSASFIKPPSSKLNIAYSSYKVNNSKGGEIRHHTSSKISVPKSSFVDKRGKDIVGEVTIEYREFHDHSDLIASGIPMAYDSAGRQYNLESAGMFDIRGSQNGEPVFIKPNSGLQVELASATADDRFNQYYLDTVAGNWKYLKRDNPLSAASTEKLNAGARHTSAAAEKKLELIKKEVEVVIPKKIDSVQKVYAKKTESLSRPKEPFKPMKPSGRQTFNIDASTKDFPELAAFSNLLFEIGDENKNYTKEMNEITWNDVKISEGPQKGKNYLLTLTHRSRVEKLIVYPVLSGADFDKAQKKYQQKFEDYNALLSKRKNDEQKLATELAEKKAAYEAELEKKRQEYERFREELAARAREQRATQNAPPASIQVKARRIFEVLSFGIYNSDCPREAPAGASVNPVFLADGKPLIPNSIFLVAYEQNSVYSFVPGSFEFIRINPAADNSFVISSGDRLYICDKKNFKKSAGASSNKFNVTELPDHLSDMKKILTL